VTSSYGLARRVPSTAATYCKVLKVLCVWLLDEQEIETDPMARMKPPQYPPSQSRLCRPTASSTGYLRRRQRQPAVLLRFLDHPTTRYAAAS
jgi:hypothetical protein